MVISIPRLIIASSMVGLAIGGTHWWSQPSQPKPLHVEVSTVKDSVPYTAAPQTASQPAPAPAPPAPVTTPKPATTVHITHSVTAAPVVTPAPSASVSGLTPTGTAPAPTAPSDGGTATHGNGTPVTSGYTSTNWSGYMATTGNYTSVSGSWTIPKATGIAGRTSADCAWVGVGGVSTDDLIQVGTTNTVSSSGTQTSSAFYELLPLAAKTITSLTVSPGDTVTASVTEVSSGSWTVSIADTTTGQSFATTVNYASSHSSAEWIEEDPSTWHNHLIPLDIFTPVTFSGGTTTSNGSSQTIATSNALPVTMLASGNPVATPTTLGSDGKTFTVTRNP